MKAMAAYFRTGKKKKLTSPCTRFRGGKEVCAGG
jgi:hypothetical protein